jgi:hypothetical protein
MSETIYTKLNIKLIGSYPNEITQTLSNRINYGKRCDCEGNLPVIKIYDWVYTEQGEEVDCVKYICPLCGGYTSIDNTQPQKTYHLKNND